MIGPRQSDYLDFLVKEVAALKPGEAIGFDLRMMALDIQAYEHNGAVFTPADRVLENIMGSAYTHSYSVHPNGKTVTFYRYEDDGKRRYTSPDRRK